MTKLFSIITLMGLLSWGLAAQINQKDSQGRRHGEWRKKHPNGELRYEGTFDHGVPVDTFKYYFEEGGLKTVNVFRGKTGNCKSYQYGEKEQLAAEGIYMNQKRDSVWTFYNRDGDIIARESYKEGEKHGKSEAYHTNGKVAEVKHYQMGEKQGEWKRFFESGRPMAEGNYSNGILDGEVVYYHPNGKPRLKGKYVKGKMHGTWYHFGDNMTLEKKVEWHYGFKKNDSDDKDTGVAPMPYRGERPDSVLEKLAK